ncbi:FG-GAP-like repeat-containing protein [Hymenobacter sp. B81]|uniref:FG-GAP-like repeat-containing protein n=1 Tax=Hymenobacter sp. B81 TaxID=3344878 RepID=UPI0037DD787E
MDVSPARNARAAAVNTNVAVTFGQAPMAASAGNIVLHSGQRGGKKAAAATVSGSTVTLNPSTDFAPGETVTAIVPASVQAAQGAQARKQVFQFTTAASGGHAHFSGTGELPVGARPEGLCTADFNEDGNIDLVTACYEGGLAGQGALSLALGNGNGTFQTPQTLVLNVGPPVAGPRGPSGVTAADVNNDGKLDLVFTCASIDEVAVALGNGNGTFQAFASQPAGLNPVGVVAADLNADGNLDLLVGSAFGNWVEVLLGTGTGTFQPGTRVAVDDNPYTLAVADVNHDGYLDFACASWTMTTGQLSGNLALGNGNGTFQASTRLSLAPSSWTLALADVTGDGNVDVLGISNATGGSNLQVLRGNGNGTFQTAVDYPLGTTAIDGVTAADVDGDGDLDVLAAGGGATGTVSTLRNNGNGTFLAPRLTTVGAFPVQVVATDFDNDGDLDFATSNGRVSPTAGNTLSVRLNTAAVALTSFTPTSGPVGTPVTLTGTGFTGATRVALNGTAASQFTVVSATQITATVPAGATSGAIAVTTPAGSATSGTAFAVTVSDLVVTTTQAVAGGTYRNITITSAGNATLSADVTVTGNLEVNAGATLNTGCARILGSGSFTLADGATLQVCDPDGISTTGATGAVQVSGTRTFSPAADYGFNGTTAQRTGTGLPAQVNTLLINNPAGVTLSAPTAVTKVLTLSGPGDLLLNGQALTLLSSATGTALVVNAGTGRVQGTATVQRYLDATLHAPASYRHLAAPVQNTTVADLALGSLVPRVNPDYNTSATPNAVRPFPTVFSYDQARVLTSPASGYSAFDKGWHSPGAATEALLPGRGYTVHLPAGQAVDFVGQLTTGNQVLALSQAASPDAGWHLLGNPYPAPVDWSRVATSDRPGLDAALYVYESTGPYAGRYRSYVNGFGNPVVPLGQAFFVRVNAAATSATLTLRNEHRLTSPDGTTVRRGGPDLRPQLQLTLHGSGLSDAAYVYFEAGASAGVDPQYDAVKIFNSSGLNVAVLASALPLAIAGMPPLAQTVSLPLQVQVTGTGSYELEATQLLNLTGTSVYLLDAQTGQRVNLRQQPRYAFQVSGTTPLTGRFTLLFGSVTSTAPGLSAAAVSIFPNPAHTGFSLQLPPLSGKAQVRVVLCNALGQEVRALDLLASTTGTRAHIDVRALAAGVYVLRVQAGATAVIKRIVVE